MEDHNELFYMKLLEYEENLPKQYDKEKCFKHWTKTNFKKTTIGKKDSQISLKTGKSIMLLRFLTRVQVDLIDMTSRTDNDFRYIMHARDQFSKFSWAYPLVNKNAAGVAERLITIFTQFGPPLILQSNNGHTFVATVISQLKLIWTNHLIINGSPIHPQYQGCIEKANGDLEINLDIWIQNNQKGWSSGLPIVVYGMNTSVSSTTEKTPYEIVFRQHPRSSIAMFKQLAAQEIVNEEDLPIEILDESSNFGVTEAVTEGE